MPVMDGLEALPLIKSAAPGAAVVVLSGFPSHTARAAAIAAGAKDYLEKNALVPTLIPQLRQLLPGIEATRRIRWTPPEPEPRPAGRQFVPVSAARLFAAGPPRYPPNDPSDRTTRWQGTTTGIGLVAQAVPTARTARGLPAAQRDLRVALGVAVADPRQMREHRPAKPGWTAGSPVADRRTSPAAVEVLRQLPGRVIEPPGRRAAPAG